MTVDRDQIRRDAAEVQPELYFSSTDKAAQLADHCLALLADHCLALLADHCLALLAEIDQYEREAVAYRQALNWVPPEGSLVNPNPLDEPITVGLLAVHIRELEARLESSRRLGISVICLRARVVRLRVERGDKTTQYPRLVVPEEWTRDRVLEYANAAHEPLGHTVTIYIWGTADQYWLADPAGFTDYTTGKRAGS